MNRDQEKHEEDMILEEYRNTTKGFADLNKSNNTKSRRTKNPNEMTMTACLTSSAFDSAPAFRNARWASSNLSVSASQFAYARYTSPMNSLFLSAISRAASQFRKFVYSETNALVSPALRKEQTSQQCVWKGHA
jgi:hypothetical protein